MLRNILVTAANGEIAEAIARILADAFPEARRHGIDASGTWPGEASFETMALVPHADDPDYPSALLAASNGVAADIVIPCSEPEILRISWEDELAERLPLVMVRRELAQVFCDKLETARWLEQHELPTASTVPLLEATGEMLPLVVKPRIGSGSRGLTIVDNAQLLMGLQDALGNDAIAQTYLPEANAEFTCVAVRIRGQVRSLVLRRKLDAGRTIEAVVEEQPEIVRIVIGIAEAADLEGSINIQLRLHEGQPRVFEINPRFSSTVLMRHLIGFRDLEWTLAGLYGHSPPPFSPPINTVVYRLNREIVRWPDGHTTST